MNTGKPCISSYKYLSNVRCSYYQVLKELGANKKHPNCAFFTQFNKLSVF